MPMKEKLCLQCNHPDHWHRHDDEQCSTQHSQPCHPDFAPFRCLGYDCEKSGYPSGTPETRCGCRDFVGAQWDTKVAELRLRAGVLSAREIDELLRLVDRIVTRRVGGRVLEGR